MLLAAQTQDLQRSRVPLVHTAREVIELFDLPAVRLGDAALGPQQNLLLAPELGHRLADPDELVRRAQIPTKQRDDRLPSPSSTASRSRAQRTAKTRPPSPRSSIARR